MWARPVRAPSSHVSSRRDYSSTVLHMKGNFVLIPEIQLPVYVQLRDLIESMKYVWRRSRWPCRLRPRSAGLRPLDCWDCRSECGWGHGCWSVVSVLCSVLSCLCDECIWIRSISGKTIGEQTRGTRKEASPMKENVRICSVTCLRMLQNCIVIDYTLHTTY